MKRMTRVIRKQFWFALGFVVMMTIMAAGPIFAAPLSDDEKYWLSYMREEEKVARDVYLTLYEKWGLTIFNNIASSEQKHMDAVKNLLVRYSLDDPAADDGVGVFSTEKFRTMYLDLIGMGDVSVTAALEVGKLIEWTDIEDLDAALAKTVHKDIIRVYQNLRAGSENHLAAFESKL